MCAKFDVVRGQEDDISVARREVDVEVVVCHQRLAERSYGLSSVWTEASERTPSNMSVLKLDMLLVLVIEAQ